MLTLKREIKPQMSLKYFKGSNYKVFSIILITGYFLCALMLIHVALPRSCPNLAFYFMLMINKLYETE